MSFFLQVKSQDLLSLIEDDKDAKTEKDYTIATFKTTRIINMHTLESVGPRTLDFRISHRFGPVNTGSYNAWGIDGPANIRLSLEYSFDGRFMFGLGRSSYEKMVDGFVKYRLVRQTTDNKTPLSVTMFASMYYNALKDVNAASNGFDKFNPSTNRYSYAYQAIIGRKFSPSFSFQIAPWMVHYNLVEKSSDDNDMFGVAGMFRYKFSKRSAITMEYAYRFPGYSDKKYYDSMGIGYEIETGGHVFQIHFVNSFGLVENQFLPFTDTQWNDAGIRLGFNVSRVFTL
ncbi:MAG: hypothetical protein DWQ44_13075 [Bacteroidetes bacterium]|nr:MAG: hypothetical protein DWQ33_13460 [Bacteroidota bacterium]REK05798.1 MAG: hypothetical protein DWQ39_05175 [Bacteroidota bacterium]REK31897.1 MAG: hypothetical protein DWQ44_13075 [Bacteroidota bacterium]REK49962.1 MAG: hypothetical protein DWQ48_05295 [Bacteroidota bacterium]